MLSMTSHQHFLDTTRFSHYPLGMTLVTCGARSVRRFGRISLSGVTVFLCMFALPLAAAKRDRQGAERAFEEARQLSAQIEQSSGPSRSDLLRCARKYRLVYDRDPQYGGSDDAIYEEAVLYATMAEKFGLAEDSGRALKLFRFLLSDYPSSSYCPDALLRLGDLNIGSLQDETAAQESYALLRKRYPRSKAAAALAARPSPPPKQDATPHTAAATTDPATPRADTTVVQSVRHWSTDDYTRVAIDMTHETHYTKTHLTNPDRMYFDISNARVGSDLQNKTLVVGDDFLNQVRVAQNRPDVVRVVLDFGAVRDYSVFELHDPYRIIIDIHGQKTAQSKTVLLTETFASTRSAAITPKEAADGKPPASPAPMRTEARSKVLDTPLPASNQIPPTLPGASAPALQVTELTAQSEAPESAKSVTPLIQTPSASPRIQPSERPAQGSEPRIRSNDAEESKSEGSAVVSASAPGKNAASTDTSPPDAPVSGVASIWPAGPSASTPPALSPSGRTPAVPARGQPSDHPAQGNEPPGRKVERVRPAAETASNSKPAAPDTASPRIPLPASSVMPKAAAPTSLGDRTLTRMLGLKIGRIVIDPGHGGHDTGTIGKGGLLEKDLVLDVARHLRDLIAAKIGAEVVLTRDDDTFVSLEERTAIANQHRADLFLSIHANASKSRSISGVETYFLDFARTIEAREVAARENATTVQNIRDLQNLVKRIAQADKSAESREFAAIIQKSLYGGAQRLFPSTKNRGVRSAPFVVLIGANMPSILAEVAFISNPRDEKMLKNGDAKERLAKALFSGIEGYMKALGVDIAQSHAQAN